jgi:hypothetical protein
MGASGGEWLTPAVSRWTPQAASRLERLVGRYHGNYGVMTMNKEQIYDEQISPLMTQIIAVCQEHGIAMVVNFAIPTEEHEDLAVITSLPDETGKIPARHVAASQILRNERPAMHLRTEHGDGRTTMTEIL